MGIEVGNRIKKLRTEKHLTAEELGKEIGKDRATVYRYENGDVDNIPYPVILQLADALETNAGYLMGKIDNPDHEIDYVYFQKEWDKNLFYQYLILNSEKPSKSKVEKETIKQKCIREFIEAIDNMPDSECNRVMEILRLAFKDYFK